MGLSEAAVRLKLELWQRGYFKNIKSVAETGSQELHIPEDAFWKLVHAAGVTNYKKEDFANLAHWPNQPRCFAKPFYEMLGVERYMCLDLNGEGGSIQQDMNLPLEDKSFYNQFDLVTDHGANEHAFNISEVYRTMHRLCKPGGLITSFQSVYSGNGYYNFDLSFFEGLAAANNYKILFSSYYVTTNRKDGRIRQHHIPIARDLFEVIDLAKACDVGICYVFQKQSDTDFEYAYQERLEVLRRGHSGYELQFLSDPPSRTYVPMWGPAVKTTTSKELLNVLGQRIVRKAKRLLPFKVK